MANRYTTGSGLWSSTSIWDGGSATPADGDAVVITAGHTVTMDTDLSSYTGLLQVTIQGGDTPAMLRFMDGTSGHLKIRTGYSLIGSSGTNKGRLLANSDGVWGNTGALAFTYKAVIELKGTTIINCQYLDIALYCTQPSNLYVATYGAIHTVTASAADDTLTKTSHGLSNNTAVMIRSSSSLPTPLKADRVYYVVSATTNTFKLADVYSGTAIDLTTDGSGTIEVYTGHTSTSTPTMNVLSDITGDTCWVTTSGHNRAALTDVDYGGYDQQRVTLSTITSSTITLSANVDSAQYPGARIYLSSRNVSIRNDHTSSINMVDYNSAQTSSGVFQCELAQTGGTGTTFYGNGIRYGEGHTVSGSVMGFSTGVSTAHEITMSGVIFACGTGMSTGNSSTISGTIAGCSTGMSYQNSATISGLIMGCSYGVGYGTFSLISGIIRDCNYGLYYTVTATVSGQVYSCNYGIVIAANCLITGCVHSCYYAAVNGGFNNVLTGSLGYNADGDLAPNSNDFTFGSTTAAPLHIICKNAKMPASPVCSNRDVTGLGHRGLNGVHCENLNRVAGANKAFLACGDIIQTACDGTGDAPSIDPDGAHGYCIEASNILSNCDSIAPLAIFDKHRIWLTAGAHTITYKIQSTYTTLASGDMALTASYVSTSSIIATTVSNTTAITTRTSDTDWTQTMAVTFTNAVDCWVDLMLELKKYESGNEVYVWPTPVIS